MTDFKRILDVKKTAQGRLLAIPGVHSVAIGAKVVAGKPTAEPAIAVFVVKKKNLSGLSSAEVIPAEIDGIKTDVVEEQMPRLLQSPVPDESQYTVLDGGIQIQGGTQLADKGTLGCIARTNDPQPKIVGVTCQHVFASWLPLTTGLAVWVGDQPLRVVIYGTNIPGSRVRMSVKLQSTGTGNEQDLGPFDYITTNADTPATIAANLAQQINVSNPNLAVPGARTTIYGPGGGVNFNPAAGFVAIPSCTANAIWADMTGTHVATFRGGILAGQLIVVDIVIVPVPTGDFQYLDVFYTTVPGDSLNSIATAIAGLINGLSNAGVSAAGPAQPGGTEVTLTSGADAVAAFNPDSGVQVFAQMQTDPPASLKATVTKFTNPAPGGCNIDFTGSVRGLNYGIYVNVNPGGTPVSNGVFFQPPLNIDLTTLASKIAGSLTTQNIPNITVTTTGPQITLAGAQEAECLVASDIRVGQPVNSFTPTWIMCCDRRIGRVLSASLLLDTALIQLDPGMKYKAEIEGIGFVVGDHAVTDDEALSATYLVRKRGRTTLLTTGLLRYLHADGDAVGGGVFHRHYTEAMKITGTSDGGDSGAAVVNSSNEVVGILFAGKSGTYYATPIQTITNALGIAVETAAALNDVRTVPAAPSTP